MTAAEWPDCQDCGIFLLRSEFASGRCDQCQKKSPPTEGAIEMPKDRSGNDLKTGDKVVVRGTVAAVSPNEDYRNVSVVTDVPMAPGTDKVTISLNGGQVEKVETPSANESTRMSGKLLTLDLTPGEEPPAA